MAYEFRSQSSLFGLPLVHVAWGVDPFTGRRRVARGFIAVGHVAQGFVAVGVIAIGVVAIGALALGLLLGAGQLAVGTWAAGQAAIGARWAAGQAASASSAVGTWVLLGREAITIAWALGAVGIAELGRREQGRLGRLVTGAVDVAHARPGAAVLAGKVVALDTVEAPLSRRPCVAFEVRRSHETTDRTCVDFLIQDQTGLVHVIGADTQLILDRDTQIAAAAMVARVSGGSAPRPVYPSSRDRVERILSPGDEVVVAGLVTRRIGVAGPVQAVVHGGWVGPVLVCNRGRLDLRATLLAAILASAAFLVAAAVCSSSLT